MQDTAINPNVVVTPPVEAPFVQNYALNVAVNTFAAAGGGAALGYIFATAGEWAYLGGSLGLAVTNVLFAEKGFHLIPTWIPASYTEKVDLFFSSSYLKLRTFKELESIQEKDWSGPERIRSLCFKQIKDSVYFIAAICFSVVINVCLGLYVIPTLYIVTVISFHALKGFSDKAQALIEKIDAQRGIVRGNP